MLSQKDLFWLYVHHLPKMHASAFQKIYAACASETDPAAAFLRHCGRYLSPEERETVESRSFEKACRSLLDYMARKKISMVTMADEQYPASLLSIENSPPVLYFIGNLSYCSAHCLGIIGTRRPTAYGRHVTELFASVCAENGLCIVSGMADGVDGIAQRAALKTGGPSIAVLGCGVDVVYPSGNRDLYEQLTEHGLILSEFPMASPGYAGNFPQRNRLIAGLSEALLVTQAGIPSGTAGTVEYALAQGKNVFTVPGSIFEPASLGTNTMLRDGGIVALDPADVLAEYGIYPQNKEKTSVKREDPLENKILSLLDREDMTVLELETQCACDSSALETALSLLEIDGYISVHPGRKYSLNR